MTFVCKLTVSSVDTRTLSVLTAWVTNVSILQSVQKCTSQSPNDLTCTKDFCFCGWRGIKEVLLIQSFYLIQGTFNTWLTRLHEKYVGKRHPDSARAAEQGITRQQLHKQWQVWTAGVKGAKQTSHHYS